MSGAIYPSLKGKLVVISGGGSGIGAALTEGFARQGARVVFLDICDGPATEIADRLSALDPAPVYRHCDLTDLDALHACFDAIRTELGTVDVLINNAANDDRHTIADVTPEYWDNRMAVNLRHKYFATREVAAGMKAQGSGVVINLGSISWHLALPDLSVYQTAKSAIEGMTRALARELGPDGIRVTCIVPGNVKTPRQEKWYTPEGEAEIVAAQCLKLRVEPKDILAMALFLASDDARACTGHEYFVDAGWR
ncbi:3-oxoacyl-ACP reductase [Maricaulis sp. W15]|uniref:SDR family NAD(P)-dependent oxidoreductase n=1 Tax=Maricaulis sp. W15 TaxID=1772333 RepID=UPI000948D53B|nr:SDR family oxidoreductase [Maricaulis sp. W15]OLF75232.1 3-oxoacyl-ACP reductase [Maricaulis sp. W15]